MEKFEVLNKTREIYNLRTREGNKPVFLHGEIIAMGFNTDSQETEVMVEHIKYK